MSKISGSKKSDGRNNDNDSFRVVSCGFFTLYTEFEFQEIFRRRTYIVVAYTAVLPYTLQSIHRMLHLKGMKLIRNLHYVHLTSVKMIKKNSKNRKNTPIYK